MEEKIKGTKPIAIWIDEPAWVDEPATPPGITIQRGEDARLSPPLEDQPIESLERPRIHIDRRLGHVGSIGVMRPFGGKGTM